MSTLSGAGASKGFYKSVSGMGAAETIVQLHKQFADSVVDYEARLRNVGTLA